MPAEIEFAARCYRARKDRIVGLGVRGRKLRLAVSVSAETELGFGRLSP